MMIFDSRMVLFARHIQDNDSNFAPEFLLKL